MKNVCVENRMQSPPRIKESPGTIMKGKIDARAEFKEFVDNMKFIDHVLPSLHEAYALMNSPEHFRHVLYWIGGSRAWSMWQQMYGIPLQSNLEQSAFTAGNMDIFHIADSRQACERYLLDYETHVVPKLLKSFNNKLSELQLPYEVDIERAGHKYFPKKKEIKPIQLVTYTLFPSYSIAFHLRSKIPTTDRVTRGTSAAVRQDEESKFDNKLLLYVEIGCVENVNFDQFFKAYITVNNGIHFLNMMGLLTMGSLIHLSRVKEKGIDVDTIRRDVLLRTVTMMNLNNKKIVLPGVYVNPAFQGILQDEVHPTMAIPAFYNDMVFVYQKLFNGTPYYSDLTVNELYLDIIKHTDEYIKQMCDGFESFIVEALRPTINACIKKTSDDIDALLESVKKPDSRKMDRAFMFVAGGDAMRRYKHDITKTKDIDTKIYIDPQLSDKKVKQINKVVVKNISDLVCYLVNHKSVILAQVTDGVREYDYFNEQKSLKTRIVFLTERADNVQFRLRLIEESSAFPVTLYSLDYRGYMLGEFNGQKFKMRYDIPLLDVVIQKNHEMFTRDQVVEIRHTNGIPIATKKFLLADLGHTYTDLESTILRVNAKKMPKDIERFYTLRAISHSAPEGSMKEVDRLRFNGKEQPIMLNSVNEHYFTYNNPVVQHYIAYFNALCKKEKTTKHKMPYSGETLYQNSNGKVNLTTIKPNIIAHAVPPPNNGIKTMSFSLQKNPSSNDMSVDVKNKQSLSSSTDRMSQ